MSEFSTNQTDAKTVVLILAIGDESNNIIGIGSTLDKAYELLGRATEKAPWASKNSIQFWEIVVDRDFVPVYQNVPGKILNPEKKSTVTTSGKRLDSVPEAGRESLPIKEDVHT